MRETEFSRMFAERRWQIIGVVSALAFLCSFASLLAVLGWLVGKPVFGLYLAGVVVLAFLVPVAKWGLKVGHEAKSEAMRQYFED